MTPLSICTYEGTYVTLTKAWKLRQSLHRGTFRLLVYNCRVSATDEAEHVKSWLGSAGAAPAGADCLADRSRGRPAVRRSS